MKTAIFIISALMAVTGYAWDYDQYREDLGYYYAEKQYANSGFKCFDPKYVWRVERYNEADRYYYNRGDRCYYNRSDRYYYDRGDRYYYNRDDTRYIAQGDSRYIDRDIIVQPVKENKYRRNEFYQKAPRYAEPIPVVSAINKSDMETGWIKFTVQPEDADILVDTKYIGQAKKYNGYPEQYVSLIGTRKVILRAKGYKEAIFLVNVDRESRTIVECKLDPTAVDEKYDDTVPDLEGNIVLRLK